MQEIHRRHELGRPRGAGAHRENVQPLGSRLPRPCDRDFDAGPCRKDEPVAEEDDPAEEFSAGDSTAACAKILAHIKEEEVS